MQFNMTEAKRSYPSSASWHGRGEEVVIAKAGKPYLHLKPFREDLTPRKPGAWKGKVRIGPDFDDDQDIIDSFYNSKIFPDGEE